MAVPFDSRRGPVADFWKRCTCHPPSPRRWTRLGWSADDAAVREAAPTAARGHNLVARARRRRRSYAAPALAGMLSRLGEGRRAAARSRSPARRVGRVRLGSARGRSSLRVQVAHGTARATRRLRGEGVDLLITTPETALALQRRVGARDRRHRRRAPRLAGELGGRGEPRAADAGPDKEAQRIVVTPTRHAPRTWSSATRAGR